MIRTVTLAVFLPALILALGAVAPRAAAQFVELEGAVRPSRVVTLAAPVEGRLAEVLVEEGQRVEADQLLVRMDDRRQSLRVQAARLQARSTADIEKWEAELGERQLLLDQAEQLLESEAVSDWEVRQRRMQRDQAAADLKKAREDHELAQVTLRLEEEALERHRLKAPFPGHVLRIRSEVGATLEISAPVIEFASLQPLEAHLFVPAESYDQLVLGARYRLEAGPPVRRELIGRLKTVDPVIDYASQTVRCVFTIDNPDAALPAGFEVRLATLEPVDTAADADE